MMVLKEHQILPIWNIDKKKYTWFTDVPLCPQAAPEQAQMESSLPELRNKCFL